MIVYKELATLEKELGYSAKQLYGLSNSITKHYKTVKIPKRNGKERELSVPDDFLKGVQRAICEKLLSAEPISPFATAYRFSSSIQKNAMPHIGKKKLLKLDIYRFFDSISYSTVKEMAFPSEKYSESNRVLLSILCYHKEVLPQGAPTSPVISNIVMREFDQTVGKWSEKKGISYTRYCDDMTFSGDFEEKTVINKVKAELKKQGFILNNTKTVVIGSEKRQAVTGIVVNEKPNIAREYKRKIRSEIFYCRKYGVESHMQRQNITEAKEKYLMGLLGRINFVLQTCKNDTEFSEYKSYVIGLLK